MADQKTTTSGKYIGQNKSSGNSATEKKATETVTKTITSGKYIGQGQKGNG